MFSRSFRVVRTSRSRLLLKNVRNLSSKAAKGKKGGKGVSQKTSENVSAATKESKPIQQQSSKATESTVSQQPSNAKPKSDKPSTEKKKMGAFGKTVIGAAIGLPIGLLAGMKLSPDFFHRCEHRYPQLVSYIRHYIPLNWPECEHKQEEVVDEEDDGPITITLKQEDLAEEIQQLIQSVEHEPSIDGVDLNRILSVLSEARKMLEMEKEALATAVCAVTTEDFAEKTPVKEEEEEWHVVNAEEPQPGHWGQVVEEEEEEEEEEVTHEPSKSVVIPEEEEEEEEEEEWHLFDSVEPAEGEWGYVDEWKDVRELIETARKVLLSKKEVKEPEEPKQVKEPEEVKEMKEVIDWEAVKELLIVAREVLLQPEEIVEVKETEEVEEEPSEPSEPEEPEEPEEVKEEEHEEEPEEVKEEEPEEVKEEEPEEVTPEPSEPSEPKEVEEVKPEEVDEPSEPEEVESEVVESQEPSTEVQQSNSVILNAVENQILSHVTEVTANLESDLNNLVNDDLLSRIVELNEQLRNNSIEESRRLYLALKLQQDEMMENQKEFLSQLEEEFREELQEKLESEKAEQVEEILTFYKSEVNRMRDFYIEHLDDYVYAKEMLQKGRVLAREEELNEKWHQRMLDEVNTIESELKEESDKRVEQVEAVHKKLQILIEKLREQENILSNALRIQEYERCLIDLQESIIRGNDISDNLAQLKSKSQDDLILQHLIAGIPESYQHQIPNELSYLTRFNELYSDARAASKTPEDASFAGHLLGRTVAAVVGTTGVDENDPLMKIEKVKEHLEEGDMKGAYEVCLTLEGPPRKVLEEWMNDVKDRLQFDLVMNQIKTHIERNL